MLETILSMDALKYPSLVQGFEKDIAAVGMAMNELIADGLMETHGDPPGVFFTIDGSSMTWRRKHQFARPSVVLLQEHLSNQSDYLHTLLCTSAVWRRLAEPEAYFGPFLPLLRLYMNGILMDFEKWTFTNARRQDLGPLPVPDLRTPI